MGVGDRCEGKEESRGCGSDFKLHAVFRGSRNVAQGGNEDAVTCWDALLFLTDIWTPPAIWWKYQVSTQWFITQNKQADTAWGAKGIIKPTKHFARCCWLHYDPVECERAFKAVITLAALLCVPPTVRPMWATSQTCGTFNMSYLL